MGLFHVSEAGARGDGGAGGESEWFCGLAESGHRTFGTSEIRSGIWGESLLVVDVRWYLQLRWILNEIT